MHPGHSGHSDHWEPSERLPHASGSAPWAARRSLLDSTGDVGLDLLQQAGQNASSIGANSTHQPHVVTEEELQHSVMIFYTVLIVMIASQAALVRWRTLHRRSYDLVTLLGLWLVPAIMSVQLFFWRFLLFWGVYTCITCYVLYQVNSDLWDTSVPKRIYTWFLWVYKTSVAVGLFGYGMVLLDVVSGGALLGWVGESGIGVLCIWYGLYFGVLNRDVAEVVSDRLVGGFGKHGRVGVPRVGNNVRDCGLCGMELRDSMSHVFDGVASEGMARSEGSKPTKDGEEKNGAWGMGSRANDDSKSIQLPTCKHIFHSECIRGWLIVGKKDTCPLCNEKVDLREVCSGTPWETRNLQWIQMLDMVRYLVVWQPTIMTALHFMFHMLDWDGTWDEDVVGADEMTADQRA